MKLAIDLQSCQTDSRDRGIGRYALSLAAALSADPRDQALMLLDGGDAPRLREARARLRCEGAVGGTYTYHHPRDGQGQVQGDVALSRCSALLKSQLLAALAPDVYLCTSFFEGYDGGAGVDTGIDRDVMGGIPSAVVAYDLIPLIFADRYLAPNPGYRRWYEQKLEEFRRFDLFCAISEATRDDLVHHLQIDPSRIQVIGGGIDPRFLEVPTEHQRGIDRRLVSEAGVGSAFVLTVGNADWRKNNLGALEAFASLPESVRRGHQLVLTQAGEDVRQALRGRFSDIAAHVAVLGKVSEALLHALYRTCRAMLFPSHYEGFGLPVLEAMAFGAPVISSSSGSLPEVVLRRDLMFEPDRPREAGPLLERLLTDRLYWLQVSEEGRQHAAGFTWNSCASEARNALTLVAGSLDRHRRWNVSKAEIGLMADAAIACTSDGAAQVRAGLMSIARAAKRRILVDVTSTSGSDARTGIQRVVRNYMAHLLEQAASGDDLEVVPITCDDDGVHCAWEFASSLHGRGDSVQRISDGPVQVQPNDLLFLLDSTWENPVRFDELIGEVWRNGGEVVRMVYDLVPIRVPGTCHPGMPPVFHSWLRHAVNLTDGMVCISDAVRIDLESFIDDELVDGALRPWTRFVHLGCDLDGSRAVEKAPKADAVMEVLDGRPFLLVIGTVEPRKDHATVLKALERVWATGEDVALVIVGKQGWNVDSLAQRLREHPEAGRRLFWLEDADDGDLQALLPATAALVQASLAEGFGLPIVEAGARGVPLILSDIPVFREVAGEQATYFHVGDAQDLARVVSEGLAGGGWQRPVGVHAMTWSESTTRLCDTLLNTCQRPSPSRYEVENN